MEGLKEKPQDNQEPRLIPETKGISNAITTHEDAHMKINVIQQGSLTANCWFVQMNGFESCATCESFPFNRKTGRLLKTSQCGGGETLALMIYNRFKGSIMDVWKAQEFWKKYKGSYGSEDYASFVDFVDSMHKERLWRYEINAYKRHIADLRQIETEKQQHSTRSLDTDFPYMQTLKSQDAKRLFRKGIHYFHHNKPCDCRAVPNSKSKYEVAYRDEAYEFKDTFKTTVYYLHQHAIVVTKTFKDRTEISLDSCGWRTLTTRDRINDYLNEITKTLNFNINLHQEKHVWYISKTKWNGNEHVELEPTQTFYDGITITIRKD